MRLWMLQSPAVVKFAILGLAVVGMAMGHAIVDVAVVGLAV